jgi:D-lactate dehydrogenase (cytochrome)
VAALVAAAPEVLPVGAQSSLTGGATPRGDLVLSTRALTTIAVLPDGRVRAGAGVPLAALQQTLRVDGLYYPPAPTFDGAFIGGTIATNAAGAATFKYGSTRRWVEEVTVVLADGSRLDIRRGDVMASVDGRFELECPNGKALRIPVPTYKMPDVAKLSAGYFARPGMDLIDLFIGSEGTLGIVVEATLRTIPVPRRLVALITCSTDSQATALTGALRREAARSWRGEGALDVSAIEYMDSRGLANVADDAFARAGIDRPAAPAVLLLVQIEVPASEDGALTALQGALDACGVDTDAQVALPGDERAAARFFELRESVPAGLNARIASTKASLNVDVEKTAGDFIVPFERLEESLTLYQQTFERFGLDYAIWGHVSDGNLHPNVIPASLDDVQRGREAILQMGRRVVEMGGAPLAEHGVGRSALKQTLLAELYGEDGIEQMRAVKRAIDPTAKLAAGVLFDL